MRIRTIYKSFIKKSKEREIEMGKYLFSTKMYNDIVFSELILLGEKPATKDVYLTLLKLYRDEINESIEKKKSFVMISESWK